MRRILREWWIEVSLLLLAMLAGFLLFERMSIRIILWDGLARLASTTGDAVLRLSRLIIPGSLSDLIGLLLVVAVVVLAVWRLRWRLVRSPSLTNRVCPKCGKPIMRVHRKALDRAISKVLVSVHRYRCSDPQCNWQGLRVDSDKHHRRTRGESSAGASRQSEG